MLNSPAGDAVTIDASRSFSVSGSAGTVFVSSGAGERLTNQSVSATPPISLNLSESANASPITRRVGGAIVLLTVNNPLNVTGSLVDDHGPGGLPTISKTIQHWPGGDHDAEHRRSRKMRSAALLGTERDDNHQRHGVRIERDRVRSPVKRWR